MKFQETKVQLLSKDRSLCEQMENSVLSSFTTYVVCMWVAHLTVGGSSCYDYCIGKVGTLCC